MLYNNIWQRDGQATPPGPPARRPADLREAAPSAAATAAGGRGAAGSVKATQRNEPLLEALVYLLNMNILITVII